MPVPFVSKKKVHTALAEAQHLEEEHLPTKNDLREEESRFYHEALELKKLTTKPSPKKRTRRNT